ncbi:hypothetical protein KUCAC02_023254, partial [Chaenocephalus aceratus]
MLHLSKGDFVWVDSSIGVPIGAEVKVSDTGQLRLIDDEGKEHKVSKKTEGTVRPMHPTSVKGVDDMIRLGDLHEAGLLRNLLVRHKEGTIYTYTGSILVAVNPYQLLPIYTTEQVHMYTDRRLGEMPPHVFAIADSCFFNMRRNKKNQCCVISGESGAGKTESTKLMLQFLAAVSGQHSWIEQQILEANPILEGARVEQYLLEKSRVCRQAPEERNYHIFYYMLMGMPAEQKKILSLGNAAEYNYLTMGKCTSCEGRDDVKEYAHFRSALKILMFTDNDSWEVSRLLAAILHLGNVDYEATIVNNLEGCGILQSSHFKMASQLLEVDPKALEKSLTQRSFMTAKESVTKPLDSAQAVDCRDAFVKHIQYQDNQSTLDVLANKSLNMMALIDEESNFPKGTDATLLQKMNQVHGKGLIYIPPKNNYETQFGITHFAGEVFYDSKGFLEKNRDALSTDLIQLVETSTNKLLKQAFHDVLSSSTIKSSVNPRMIITSASSSLRQASDGKKRVPTLTGQFRQSLDSLMKTLTVCQPYFIRCIKPNDFKRPMLFDRELCMRQLRYSGMMETIRIRKAGYPVRYTFEEFFIRYRVLLRTSLCDPKQESKQKCCESICESVLSGEGDWKTGKTKIFLKDFHDTMLELERMKELNEKALLIQKVLRGYRYRREYLRKKAAALVIQKHWRGHKGRKLYKVVQHGFARLQAQVRSRQLHFLYKKKREAAVVLQARVRGYLAKKEWKRKRDAVILLQAHTRGGLARKAVRKMKTDRYLSAKEKEDERRVILGRQKHLEKCSGRKKEMEAKAQNEAITDQEMVDSIFDFLPVVVGGQEGQAPVGFEKFEVQPPTPTSARGCCCPCLPRRSRRCPEAGSRKLYKRRSAFMPQERFMPQELISRKDRRLSHMVGLDQRVLRNKKERKPTTLPEEPGQNRKGSMFIDLLARNRKPSAAPAEAANPKVYTVPEQSPRTRKGSTFTDLLTRNKKAATESAPPTSSLRNLPSSWRSESVKEDGDSWREREPTLDRPLTSLEKLHIIVGYAIVRRDLRDEIYCQICKQLQDNNNRNSYFRGWILLSLCLGVFPPSDRFIRYLQSFIRFAPGGYAPYCAERLRRTLLNGVRGEPPAWLELQATKTKKPMIVSVNLMDGRSINLPVDSSSTSREICQLLSNKIKLKDTFGFSVYVALYEKVWALGSGREHVMDAISQCEQEVKRGGGQEQHAPWRLFFRKEVFTPWHDCKEDTISTELIYKQIIHGLKFGEYQSKKEDDLVQLTAKHVYIQHGSESSAECEGSCAGLHQQLSAGGQVRGQVGADGQHCSRSGSLCEFKTESGLCEGGDGGLRPGEVAHVLLPLLRSCQAVRSCAAEEQVHCGHKLDWYHLPGREREEAAGALLPEVTGGVHSVSVQPGRESADSEGDFTLSGGMAEDMSELLTMFLSGLTSRVSVRCDLKEADTQDDPMLLSFKKGELIIIIKDDEFAQERGWIKGQNESTKHTGAVPTEAIIILPTLSKPTNQVMSLINLSPNQRKHIIQANQKETGTMERLAPATLKDFSLEYFRQPTKDVNRQVMSRNAAPERLWANSREPIRQPLLQKLVGNPELSHKACLAFTDILHTYMKNYPTKQMQSPLEHTDLIFSPATQNEALRDEIYCQIMKQMSSNNNR